MTRVAVLSGGSFGTAMGKVMSDAGCQVTMLMQYPEWAEAINTKHENAQFWPDIPLPEALRATADHREALDGADIVVMAVPAQLLGTLLPQWVSDFPADSTVVSVMKGIEMSTMRRMSQVISEAGQIAPERVGVISGPNLAKEVIREQPSATVVSVPDPDRAKIVQAACMNRYFRPYTNPDIIGVETAGSVKNVIALATGMSDGMGFGDNTRGTLITRGLAEMTRFGLALGAQVQTFMGLAGVGDLVATCTSVLSRNHIVGEALGQGLTLEQAVERAKTTSEGVKSARPILQKATELGVEMPITEQVVRVLYEGASPHDAVASLMGRPSKSEGV